MAVQIIAEIGMNHDGSLGQAKALIRAAAACGADAVKFQTHIAAAETLRDAPAPLYFQDENRFAYFTRTAFTREQHGVLKNQADACGVEFISSPFSIEAVELLEQVGVRRFKIPSGEVTNTPYLERLAKTGKQLLLSSGMSTWSELDEAVQTLQRHGGSDLVLLQCTSAYPCPAEDAGLNVMEEMRRRYGYPVGLSDHTLGIGVAVAAVARGACLIEKHFTLSKKMYGPDASTSADPVEFGLLVRTIREAEAALTHAVEKDQAAAALHDMKTTFEKSIVAACDLPKHTKLNKEHLAFKKPGGGLPPRLYQGLIGRVLAVDVFQDYPFQEQDFFTEQR